MMVPSAATDNARAIALMVLAMGLFALEDTFVKLAFGSVDIGQILAILGFVGAAFFAAMTQTRRDYFQMAHFTDPMVLIRVVGEVVGTFGFVTAIALIPLSTASAILQATPLAVTLGAVIFLRETVGWRRWGAIIAGFAGVIIIIRPGMAGYDANSLFAVLGVIGLGTRDLVTRRIPASVPTAIISFQAFGAVGLLGLALMVFDQGWQPVSGSAALTLGAAAFVGIIAYFVLTTALRIGEISAIAPFRYSRLVFAIVIGVLVFGERPDGWTLIGAAIVIGAGLYVLMRERALARRAGSV